MTIPKLGKPKQADPAINCDSLSLISDEDHLVAGWRYDVITSDVRVSDREGVRTARLVAAASQTRTHAM